MQLKIHINNKVIYLCDELDANLTKLAHLPDYVFIDELDVHTIKSMLHEIKLPAVIGGIFWHEDFKKLKKEFFKKFKIIDAGGGFVVNEKKEVLLIFRRGYWDLPKGKLDKGETIEECALREVHEETGLKKVKLKKPLITTYHTYEQGSQSILKVSHWFMMEAKSTEKLIAQTEEDITDIRWVPITNVEQYKPNAYASIVDVFEAAV